MASSAGGLVQRRRNAKGQAEETHEEDVGEKDLFDDDNEYDADNRIKLTLLEEVVLLGLKDQAGYLSWWNDNISYVLRGCILIELSFRGRIDTTKDSRRRPVSERIVEVIDKTPTGDVILDEALRYIAGDKQSIVSWMDFLSGETWNFMKANYQLKQVRERIQKALVDKGVLRTEKANFILFDRATHPVANMAVKEDTIRKVTDCLLQRGPAPDRRTIALVCAAYAGNVLENALYPLSSSQQDTCFYKADEILAEYSKITEKNAKNNTEVMAGVLSVFSKMDSLL